MELASLSESTFDPDGSFLHLDELFADGKAEARSFADADGREADLIELFEDVGKFFRGDADAVVGYRNFDGIPLYGAVDKDFSTGQSEFRSITEEVVEDLAQSHGVCCDAHGEVFAHANVDGARVGIGPDGHDGFSDDLDEIDGLGAEVKASRLDAAKIEHVVDEAEQVLGIDVDMAHKVRLRVVERAFAFFDEEFGEADDGMERGSELVADAGHELGFELVEAFCFLLPGLELGHVAFLQRADADFSEFALGNVADDGRDVDTVLGFHGAEADLYGKFTAIFALGKEVEGEAHGPHHSCLCKGFAALVVGSAVGRRNEQVNILTHQLFARVAEHLLGSMVGDDDRAVRIYLEDGVGGILDELAIFAFGEHFSASVGFLQGEEDLAIGEGSGGVGTFGDIAGDLGDAEDIPVGIDDRGEAEGDHDLLSILMFTGNKRVVDAAAVTEDAEEKADTFLFAGPGEERDGMADRLLGFVAEDAGGGGVPGGNDAMQGHAEDGVVRRLDDGGKPAFRYGAVVVHLKGGRDFAWIGKATTHRDPPRKD